MYNIELMQQSIYALYTQHCPNTTSTKDGSCFIVSGQRCEEAKRPILSCVVEPRTNM